MMLHTLALAATALTALGALGCSDPVPPPAQGGMSINIAPASPQPSGTSCQRTTGHNAVIGNPAPTSSQKGKPVVDGENGAAVSCRVSGGGSVSGRMKGVNASFQISGGELSGSTGTGLITTYDPKGLTLTSPSTSPCKLTTVQIKPGAAWASFTCETYVDTSTPLTATCRATGVFVFENCEE